MGVWKQILQIIDCMSPRGACFALDQLQIKFTPRSCRLRQIRRLNADW